MAQEDEAFMPKGGKTLFLELKDTPRAAELREIGNLARTEPEWRDYLAERHKQLSEREASELAAYLAVNLPLPEGAVAQAEGKTTSPRPCRRTAASLPGRNASSAIRCFPAI